MRPLFIHVSMDVKMKSTQSILQQFRHLRLELWSVVTEFYDSLNKYLNF